MRLKNLQKGDLHLARTPDFEMNISRTIWRIEVSDGSCFCIFHTRSFELNFFRSEFPFKTYNQHKITTTSKYLSHFGCLPGLYQKMAHAFGRAYFKLTFNALIALKHLIAVSSRWPKGPLVNYKSCFLLPVVLF